MFLESIHLQGFLSFPPDSPPIPLKALNVLIGPNGSGKSNILEAFSVLRAAPSDLSVPFRRGGVVRNWVWGAREDKEASIGLNFPQIDQIDPVSYVFSFSDNRGKVFVEKEYIKIRDQDDFHYKMEDGVSVLLKKVGLGLKARFSDEIFEDVSRSQSIFSQIKNRVRYPLLYKISNFLDDINLISDWSFGRDAVVRRASDASSISDRLLGDQTNFASLVQEVYFSEESKVNRVMKRFLPRFESIKTRVVGGSVLLYFVESGTENPVPTARLSDGTLRFLAIVVTLLHPNPPSLLCIEEPELGMHPDAAALLAELLVEASQRMQIIVTTHSEAFLSALTRHDVNVLVTENFGQGTEVTQVDQEQLASWLDEYTLGDLWRIGKIGGNP